MCWERFCSAYYAFIAKPVRQDLTSFFAEVSKFVPAGIHENPRVLAWKVLLLQTLLYWMHCTQGRLLKGVAGMGISRVCCKQQASSSIGMRYQQQQKWLRLYRSCYSEPALRRIGLPRSGCDIAIPGKALCFFIDLSPILIIFVSSLYCSWRLSGVPGLCSSLSVLIPIQPYSNSAANLDGCLTFTESLLWEQRSKYQACLGLSLRSPPWISCSISMTISSYIHSSAAEMA